MLCHNCGTQLKDSSAFCAEYGSPVKKSKNIAQATVPSLNAQQGNKNHYEFQTSITAFWLKGHISVNDQMLRGEAPNILFGMIPYGQSSVSVPIRTLSDVNYRSTFMSGRFFIGALLAFAGMWMFSYIEGSSSAFAYFFIGLLMMVFGVVTCMNAFVAVVIYRTSGINRYIFAPIFCKKALLALKEDLDVRCGANNAKPFNTQNELHQVIASEQLGINQPATLVDAIGQG